MLREDKDDRSLNKEYCSIVQGKTWILLCIISRIKTTFL